MKKGNSRRYYRIIFILFLILAVSIGVWSSLNSGSSNLEFEYSQCLEGDITPYTMSNEVISQQWIDNKLEIIVRAKANCCSNKRGGYSIENNDIRLTLIEYGPLCRCMCAFDLKYVISSLEKKDYNIYIGDA